MTFYDISGKIELKTSEPKDILVERMSGSLVAEEAKVNLLDDSYLEFELPFFQSPRLRFYRPLVSITSGRINFIQVGPEHLRIEYQLSLRRVRLACLFFNIVPISFAILRSLSSSEITFALPVNLCCFGCTGTALIWGWLYGMSWVVNSVSFDYYIRRVCT